MDFFLGKLAWFTVGKGGTFLQDAERPDNRTAPTETLDPDGKVEMRSLGLRAPQMIGWNLDVTQRVFFNPKLICNRCIHDACSLCSKALFSPQKRCPRHADGEEEKEKESSENRAETPIVFGRQVTAIRINRASRVREGSNDSHDSQLHAQKQREFLKGDSRNRRAGQQNYRQQRGRICVDAGE